MGFTNLTKEKEYWEQVLKSTVDTEIWNEFYHYISIYF